MNDSFSQASVPRAETHRPLILDRGGAYGQTGGLLAPRAGYIDALALGFNQFDDQMNPHRKADLVNLARGHKVPLVAPP